MIRISDLVYRIGGRAVLDGASVAVPDGSRVGLVGRNGAGKTTLFRLIAGDLAPDRGGIELARGQRLGQVAQEAPSGPEPILAIVLAADAERARLLAEAEHATDPARIAEVHARLVDIGAHAAPARAARILAGLGFDADAQARPASEFSGGWRMRVALAAMLFAEPDVLLLDEPTNYLDLEGTLWLESHLAAYPKTLVIISHDRDLLNGSVEQILHLDRGRLTLWKGNFDQFERQRREKRTLDEKAAKKQDEKRKHLQAFVDRFRAKASKAVQAQSRLKMLAKLGPIEPVVDEATVPIAFPEPAKELASPIVACDDVAVGYGGRPVLRRLDLRIDADDRIGLLGSNGNGKSTFAKLVSQKLVPMAGGLTRASALRVGYFAQHQTDELRLDQSVLGHVRRLLPGAPEAKVRGTAARFGFSGERAETPVGSLSGGEKARLLLGLATWEGPQLLVLDEPTNHLDIDARASLVEAINEFSGAVILISHDRWLLEACADRLWLVKDGTVKPFDGDLEAYRRMVLAEARGEQGESKAAAPASDRPAASRKPVLGPIRKRIEAAEAEMNRARTRLSGIDALLAVPDIFRKEPVKAAELSRLRHQTEAVLAHAEEEWLSASADLESAV